MTETERVCDLQCHCVTYCAIVYSRSRSRNIREKRGDFGAILFVQNQEIKSSSSQDDNDGQWFFDCHLCFMRKKCGEITQPPFLTRLVVNEKGDVGGDPPTPLFNPIGVYLEPIVVCTQGSLVS